MTDGSQELQNYSPNKLFVLENRGKQITSSMTYTSNGKQVASVTDARGYTTTNTYDADQRLLTKVTDAKGNVTNYTYNSDTDQLTKVSATVGGTTVSNTYTYDNADRLSSIGHNGFTYNFEYDVFGNPTKVKVGDTVLATYEYLPYNGPQKSLTYGKGVTVTNEYDKDFRLVSQKYKDSSGYEKTVFENTYDAYNNLVVHKNLSRDTTYEYGYDLIGRMTAMEQRKSTNNAVMQKLQISYDDKNRVESVVSKVGSSTKKTGYIYGNASGGEKPGLMYGIRVDGLRRSTLSYDELSRLTEKAVRIGTGKYYRTSYTYVPGAKSYQTTTLPESITNGSSTLKYTYDAIGNIEKIYENNSLKASYTYDALSRLTRENNKWLNKTICYSYDIGGNITTKKEYAYTTGTLGTVQKTISYGYGNSQWKDQMTSYNGQTITYDAIGNPLSYRDGMSMSWYDRKYLTHLTKDKTYYFAYDSDGRRVEKTTVNGHDPEKTVTYYWNGDDIIAIQDGTDLLHFIYDQDGQLFSVDLNGTPYYYIYNLQGDVIGLIDSNGSQVVSYQYDTWGNIISMTDTSGTDIGIKNPFRYRGYCYDEETGLYYLKSRYYDPVTGRFVSADDAGVLAVEQGNLNQYNQYVYCLNNPVNGKDSEGLFVISTMIAGAICGAVINAGLSAAEACMYGEDVKKAALIGAVSGAACGALGSVSFASTVATVLVKAMGGAVIGAATECVNQWGKEKKNWGKLVFNTAWGAVSAAIPLPGKFSKSDEILATATWGSVVTLGTGVVGMGNRTFFPDSEEETSWAIKAHDSRYYNHKSWSVASHDSRYYNHKSWSVKSHDSRYYNKTSWAVKSHDPRYYLV